MNKSRKFKVTSPQKDHFVEGQISIRSPKVRNGLAILGSSQRLQAARLSMPRKAGPKGGFLNDISNSPRASDAFLRSSGNGAFRSNKFSSPSPTKAPQRMSGSVDLIELEQEYLTASKALNGKSTVPRVPENAAALARPDMISPVKQKDSDFAKTFTTDLKGRMSVSHLGLK